MNSSLRSLLLTFVAAGAVHAQEPGPAPSVNPPVAKSEPSRFQLLPKSMSSTPRIEMTVYSERTDYGRTLPEPSAEKPAYYVAQSQGYQPMGSSPDGILQPPDPAQIEKLLHATLAESGFNVSDDAHPPTLALIYYWGTHAGVDPKEALSTATEQELEDNFETKTLINVHQRDILERAMLVGGPAFAKKLAHEMAYGPRPGDFTARHQHLRYQTEHNLYYIAVSAYDYASLAKGERRLAWRTTLTVNEQGVSLKETLPPLIVSATNFFGRDTGGAVALERHINRGSVKLGPLNIIGEATPEQVGAKAK